MVTVHWTCLESMKLKHMLLHVFCPEGGSGVGRRLGDTIVDYLQSLGDSVLQKLQAVVSDNGADALVAAKRIRERYCEHYDMEGFRDDFLIRCIDHSIQLAVKSALTFIDPINEKLRELLKALKNSKLKRSIFRKEAKLRKFSSVEPPQPDSRTRWGSTHIMHAQSVAKKSLLNFITDATRVLLSSDWTHTIGLVLKK
jgi:predicted ATPase